MRAIKGQDHANDKRAASLGWEDKGWIDRELDGAYFQDARLGKRLRALLGLMANGIGHAIALAGQDWANTKAAYRFFANDRITQEEILRGHFAARAGRAGQVEGPIPVLHDASEFFYTRTDDCPLGLLKRRSHNLDGAKMKREHALRGILMRASMVVTPAGLPLGLAAIKLWTRQKFKGTDALKRKINPTRIPIGEKESSKWLENARPSQALLSRPADSLPIADQEGDIDELFCLAEELQTQFLIRTCVDRWAEEGGTTVAAVMKQAPLRGHPPLEIRDAKGKGRRAVLGVKFERITLRPPLGKQKAYPELSVTVIHAVEKHRPSGRERIQWKLITHLPVHRLKEAIEKLEGHALRWKIETFHQILKSGCRAEKSKLRASERLAKLLCVFCILSWRGFWMTMGSRTAPDAPPELALTDDEKRILDRLFGHDRNDKLYLADSLERLAQLGGYLARPNDLPAGTMVRWRGLTRLTDIQLGYQLAKAFQQKL